MFNAREGSLEIRVRGGGAFFERAERRVVEDFPPGAFGDVVGGRPLLPIAEFAGFVGGGGGVGGWFVGGADFGEGVDVRREKYDRRNAGDAVDESQNLLTSIPTRVALS